MDVKAEDKEDGLVPQDQHGSSQGRQSAFFQPNNKFVSLSFKDMLPRAENVTPLPSSLPPHSHLNHS